MSSTNTSLAAISALNYTSAVFHQVWCFVLICLGTIGHLFNFYVFTRPTLRSNPCARYFLAATCGGFLVTYVNTIFRLLQRSYGTDLFTYSIVSCRILQYSLYWAKAQVSWFIALASIDRFLCSSRSAALRAWSNVRVATRASLLVIPIVGLAYIYVPILFQIKQQPRQCFLQPYGFATFLSVWNLFVFSLGPSITMLIFGSLTIRHVQQSTKRRPGQPAHIQIEVGAAGSVTAQEQNKRQKRTDQQLIRMMFIQCLYFTLMSTPVSAYWLFNTARSSLVLNAFQLAQDSLFASASGVISLTSACTSFYLFTLSSQLFRNELMHLFRRRPPTLVQMNNRGTRATMPTD